MTYVADPSLLHIGRAPLRKRILAKSNGHCAYCGKRALSIWKITIDHVIPRSAGGSDDDENLVAACKSCNYRKSDRPLHWLREWMQRQENGRPAFSWEQREYLLRKGFDFPVEPQFKFFIETCGYAEIAGVFVLSLESADG